MKIAIVKPIKIRRGDNGGLRAILDYIKKDAKTQSSELVFGWNCQKDRVFEDMLLTKKIFGKTSGRQYAHFVQGFHPRDELTPELAFKIGQEYIARNKKWRDYQILMAVHTNEEHLHIHYVINSVNSKTGMKWQCSQQDMKYFRELSDELCRKYNLHVLENANRKHRSYGENAAFQKGTSWKAKLAEDIKNCMEQATSRADFYHLLNEQGIDIDIGNTSTLFTILKGTYGLNKEMRCGDKKLQAYGDFNAAAINNYFAKIPGLQNMMNCLENNPSLLFDAMYDLGKLFGVSSEDMLDRFYSRTFSALEGRALKEWILRNKDRAFEVNTASWFSQSHEQEQGYEL